jgi:hypothetical protein
MTIHDLPPRKFTREMAEAINARMGQLEAPRIMDLEAPRIMDMENPLVDLERLVLGILALADDNDDGGDLKACYVLALKASERCLELKRIWSSICHRSS